MNKQKKLSFRAIIAAILALALVLCTFSACSGKSSDSKDSDSKETSETAKSEEKKTDDSAAGNKKNKDDVSAVVNNVGDIIKFGTYEQDNDTSNGKEEIEWIVLAKEENRMLVVSKYALDCQLYNTEHTDVTWETCTLRTWLNEDFLNEAFSSEEQSRIQTTDVVNNDNSHYGTSGGNDTEDKIFLLSTDEEEKYFSSDEARMCAPTAYAIAQGAYTNDYYKTADGEASGYWWLRTPGDDGYRACRVHFRGSVHYSGDYVDEYGYGVNNSGGGVRPALYINL